MKVDKHSLRKKLIWVSNISAPYRIPIWRELSKEFDLTIILMSGKERNRNWERLEQSENYQVIYLDSKSIWLSNEVLLYFSISKIRKSLSNLRPELIYVDGYEHPIYQYIFYRYRRNTTVKTYLGYRGTKASQRLKGNGYNVLRRLLFSNADFVVTSGKTPQGQRWIAGFQEVEF